MPHCTNSSHGHNARMVRSSLAVLIIDENVVRASILEDGLREAGHTRVSVISAMRGLARRIVEADPEMIVIDLENPNRDVLEKMFQVSRSVRRPIAMFVDRSDHASIEAAIDAGVSAYVVDGLRKERVKPILDMTISRFNAFHRLREELDRTKQASSRPQGDREGEGHPDEDARHPGGGGLCAPPQDRDEREPQPSARHGAHLSRHRCRWTGRGPGEERRQRGSAPAHPRLHPAGRLRAAGGGGRDGIRRSGGPRPRPRPRDLLGQYPRPGDARPLPRRAHARAAPHRLDARHRQPHRGADGGPLLVRARRQCGHGFHRPSHKQMARPGRARRRSGAVAAGNRALVRRARAARRRRSPSPWSSPSRGTITNSATGCASAGLDPDRDIRLVVLPPPFMADALAEGHVDAFCVGEPWNSIAVDRGVGAIVVSKSALWRQRPGEGARRSAPTSPSATPRRSAR